MEHKILLDFVMNLMSYGEINYVAKQGTFNLQLNLGDRGAERSARRAQHGTICREVKP
jgi:hypothetical protein